MPKQRAAAVPLKEACVQAAHEVIAERGVEGLSLRDVARRLGVSHQAPYKHFASRDHLLAEVIRRCFEGFAAHLDRRHPAPDPMADLGSLGRRYLGYASAHPLEYRLMFGTPWPSPAEHPELVKNAVHAFDVLRAVLQRLNGETAAASKIDLDAIFIWSALHGVASIVRANVMPELKLSRKTRDEAAPYVMQMISRALGAVALTPDTASAAAPSARRRRPSSAR
jgi:AcrR family transcriptional regulator